MKAVVEVMLVRLPRSENRCAGGAGLGVGDGVAGPPDGDVAAQLGVFGAVELLRPRHAVVRAIPAERVLLETDGPYARSGNGPAHPHELPEVVTALAGGWGRTVDDATDLVRQNQGRFLASAKANRPRE